MIQKKMTGKIRLNPVSPTEAREVNAKKQVAAKHANAHSLMVTNLVCRIAAAQNNFATPTITNRYSG